MGQLEAGQSDPPVKPACTLWMYSLQSTEGEDMKVLPDVLVGDPEFGFIYYHHCERSRSCNL